MPLTPESTEVREPFELLHAASRRVPCVFHRTPDATHLGIGVAEACRSDHGESLADVERRLRDRLRERYRPQLSDDHRLFFQVAFDPDRRSDRHWSAFDRMRVVAPGVSVCWRRGSPTVATLGDVDVEELLARSDDSEGPSESGGPLRVEWEAPNAYRSGVQRAIANEEIDKAVLSRVAEVTGDRPFQPSDITESLADRDPDARIFFVSPGPDRSTFVGASPERLIRLRGDDARTVSLAGTEDRRHRDPELAAEQLLRSSKQRDEHDYVTEMIVDTLESLGADVEAPDAPTPVVLPDVVHLETPITARMPETCRLVDLVDALHPTPAVCGTPTDPARRLIREVEPFDRGLYTGVVGVTDLDGSGDATVALRCGLIDGRRARLFAGGGITSESDVDAEAAETENKLAPMMEALREVMRDQLDR